MLTPTWVTRSVTRKGPGLGCAGPVEMSTRLPGRSTPARDQRPIPHHSASVRGKAQSPAQPPQDLPDLSDEQVQPVEVGMMVRLEREPVEVQRQVEFLAVVVA